jgi:hypothetical protein
MGWIGLTAAGTIVFLVIQEGYVAANGWIGPRLIQAAAAQLPARRRDDRREEWLAEYETFRSRGLILRATLFAIGVTVATVRIRYAHRPQHLRARRSEADLVPVSAGTSTFSQLIMAAETRGWRVERRAHHIRLSCPCPEAHIFMWSSPEPHSGFRLTRAVEFLQEETCWAHAAGPRWLNWLTTLPARIRRSARR